MSVDDAFPRTKKSDLLLLNNSPRVLRFVRGSNVAIRWTRRRGAQIRRPGPQERQCDHHSAGVRVKADRLASRLVVGRDCPSSSASSARKRLEVVAMRVVVARGIPL